jgi:hypothetical protein
MNDFDAAIDWLVQSGRAKSKGDARRRLMEGATQVTPDEFGISKGLDLNMSTWLGNLARGLAGASPAIDGLAKARRDQGRAIQFVGQNAGIAYDATMEQLRPRPWWKRIFGA